MTQVRILYVPAEESKSVTIKVSKERKNDAMFPFTRWIRCVASSENYYFLTLFDAHIKRTLERGDETKAIKLKYKLGNFRVCLAR